MSYPDINDEYFADKINKKFERYKIPKRKKSFKEICFSKQFELQLPQQFLSKYINPSNSYKSILVFHRIGAGKTCTGITIGEEWKHLRKIIVVVPASLIGNFRGELRSKCAGNSYLTDKDREKLKILHPTSREFKEIIEKSDRKINEYYNIFSYNKFIESIKNDRLKLNKSVLIIDEIQNMVSEKGTYYKVLYNAIHSAPPDLRIVLLSATPMFDKPSEIALTMNLLRIPYELPTGIEFEKMFIKTSKSKTSGQYSYKVQDLDIFKERIKGYVSYFRGAPEYVFPETIIKYIYCEMSEFQYKSYITVIEKEKKNKKNDKARTIRAFRVGEILDLPINFFLGARIISNIAFPNKSISEKGFASFRGKFLELENLKEFSIKFYTIMKRINRSRGKIFFYSAFRRYGGIESFIKVLENYGYKNYFVYGEGRKRYAVFSGEEDIKSKDEIKAVFNQKENLDGSKLKIILGSMAAKEGISFTAVQQVHILEPYWNEKRLDQIIGRSSRHCSHKDVPEEKRKVKVYIYIATHPNEPETIDKYIANLAEQKNKLIDQFETAIKEAAVDCELNKNANEAPGEEINCMK